MDYGADPFKRDNSNRTARMTVISQIFSKTTFIDQLYRYGAFHFKYFVEFTLYFSLIIQKWSHHLGLQSATHQIVEVFSYDSMKIWAVDPWQKTVLKSNKSARAVI